MHVMMLVCVCASRYQLGRPFTTVVKYRVRLSWRLLQERLSSRQNDDGWRRQMMLVKKDEMDGKAVFARVK